MTVRSRRRLMKTIDAERVKKAIEEAEGETSGEIRVSVARSSGGRSAASPNGPSSG